MAKAKCPKCRGDKLKVERRPDGEAVCMNCGWLGPYNECVSSVVHLKEVEPDREDMLAEVETLKKMVMDGDVDCYMIAFIDKGGAQRLWTSRTSGYKKAFLVQFINSWMNSWFGIEKG